VSAKSAENNRFKQLHPHLLDLQGLSYINTLYYDEVESDSDVFALTEDHREFDDDDQGVEVEEKMDFSDESSDVDTEDDEV
jgi:hypothetical protein